LPTLYPGTSQAQNPLARLGRMTDWREVGEELYLGAGLHLLAVDGEEKPLREVRSVEFEHDGREGASPVRADGEGPSVES
ncbi:MAG TPA: type VI secretion system accessory protein TagJ, partial [Pyrinomonadaceae bacterium]|nr:type VI secretion system accessory protein TagJ [Pyrinomonadaceae bacterium]